MMLSALRMVPNLCAITRQVRSSPNTSSACWMEFSVTVSKADVAVKHVNSIEKKRG